MYTRKLRLIHRTYQHHSNLPHVSESTTEEDWNICSCYSDGVRSYRMRPKAPLIGPSRPWLPQPAPPGPSVPMAPLRLGGGGR